MSESLFTNDSARSLISSNLGNGENTQYELISEAEIIGKTGEINTNFDNYESDLETAFLMHKSETYFNS